MRAERALEIEDVGDREVEALRSGWGHDMRGVACEKQPAMTHRLGDEAAQRRNRLFDRRTRYDPAGEVVRKPPFQLLPELLVRPVLDPRVEAALDVVAAQHGVAQRGECKASVVPGVNDIPDRRRFRHDAERAERIGALEYSQHGLRNALAGYAVEPVAAGDEVAVDRFGYAALVVSHLRR